MVDKKVAGKYNVKKRKLMKGEEMIRYFDDRGRKVVFAMIAVLVFALIQMPIVFANDLSMYNVWSGAKIHYRDFKETHWANTYVADMTQKGIMMGYPDGTFRPDENVTYGEFIKMTVVAAEVGYAEGVIETGRNWAEGYYDKALELGYFTKYDIPENMLNRPVQRKHMALIIENALGDQDIEGYDDVQAGIGDVDYLTLHEYQIVKAFASGVFVGYEDGSFGPDSYLKRSEAAAAISRFAAITDNVGSGNSVSEVPDAVTSGDIQVTDGGIPARKYDISDYITNLDELYQFDFGNKKYCEIIEEYPYSITLYTSLLGGEALYFGDVNRARGVAIVTDGIVKELGHAGGDKYYVTGQLDKPFPKDFDYICIFKSSSDTVTLINNPFK